MNEDKDKANRLRSDDQFLRDTVLNFMIAERDTTVETRIREELSIIPYGKSRKWWEFDLKELHKLAYLHGAICEALRLYPPLPFQHKAPAKPDILPSEHWVMISEKGEIKREPSYKFLSFNAGLRTCLGKEVAFTQIKIVAATILHNYNVVQVVEDDNTNGPNVSIILQMKHGLTVRVFKRWDD
ncbi:hypothetical protein ACOSQ4_022333 [Xanthoceras sorbifolium]